MNAPPPEHNVTFVGRQGDTVVAVTIAPAVDNVTAVRREVQAAAALANNVPDYGRAARQAELRVAMLEAETDIRRALAGPARRWLLAAAELGALKSLDWRPRPLPAEHVARRAAKAGCVT